MTFFFSLKIQFKKVFKMAQQFSFINPYKNNVITYPVYLLLGNVGLKELVYIPARKRLKTSIKIRYLTGNVKRKM